MKETETPNNLTVKPAQNIIQSFYITTARYDFDITEKRVLTGIITALQHLLEGKKLKGLYKLEPNLFDKGITFPTSLVIGEGTHYRQLHQALKKLQGKQLTYEDNKIWISIPLIGKTLHNKQEGTLTINLYNEMVELFMNFTKGYSKYIAEVSLSLSSVASAKLYELISNQRNPITYDIEHLKKILGAEKTYSRTCNFMQRVITQAQKELRDKANWSFNYTTKTEGRQRKITHITLIPIHHTDREPEEVQRAEARRKTYLSGFVPEYEVRQMLRRFGFTPREIKNNATTVNTFCQLPNIDHKKRIAEIWQHAAFADNPKGYVIRALANEIENFKNSLG